MVTPLVFLPIGQRWLFDTRELSKTTWSKCQEEPSFMAAQYQRSNMGEPAECVVRTVICSQYHEGMNITFAVLP